ncbi:MAG TPA: Asp-tRNA(Asn)/Glu-tRNA(Gln) amidotransferase subunit GatB [Myxococcaceae bacterium]|nr:Asp-tRNA(Asn)/Glu-tRNA(Gln) amidotransferase subunit GatB [Myxococcaceae bacterium]
MPIADFQPVIGLEVHAQLLTDTKLFCGCPTSFGAAPNTQVCPVCLGMPGVLPSLNAQAVRFAVRTGLALGCRVREQSAWSRKNYFYPDLPKGYQITQFERPICEGGALVVDAPSGEIRVRLHHIHIEEDAGKSVHDAEGGASLVDLNRAGVPLLEIVGEPDLRSSEEAAEYLKALRDVLMYLGVNDGNLEEGSFRCDANVSVMPKGSKTLGQRVELKNINSFRFVRQAIDYEIARQVDVIESGGTILQETRLWDTVRGETRAMRSKEDAHDYRYFPEPDLPPLRISPELIESERAQLPELPRALRQRLMSQYGLAADVAGVLTSDRALVTWFEETAALTPDARRVANWCQGELLRVLKETGTSLQALKMTPAMFARLLQLVENGTLSQNAAKDVLDEMVRSGREAQVIVEEKGLGQINDEGAVAAVVDEVLGAHAAEVEKYRGGQQKLFGFLMGQVMKALRGKGNPQLVNRLLRDRLEG